MQLERSALADIIREQEVQTRPRYGGQNYAQQVFIQNTSSYRFKQPKFVSLNTSTHADNTAATYFSNLKDPHLEDAILVTPGNTESIAIARTPNSASLNTDKIATFALNYKPGQIMYHQHPGNPDAQIESALASGNRQYAAALSRLPRDHPIFTTLMHVPSDADMRTALSVQALGYTKHNHTIEQRIAVMEDGKPIKALGYGLSNRGLATYKTLVQEANKAAQTYQHNQTRTNHDAMTRAGRNFGNYVQGQLDAYKKELAVFQTQIQNWRPSDGEMSASGFYSRVAKNTDLEVIDRGHVGPKVTVTPYARAVQDITGHALTQNQLLQLRVAARAQSKSYEAQMRPRLIMGEKPTAHPGQYAPARSAYTLLVAPQLQY